MGIKYEVSRAIYILTGDMFLADLGKIFMKYCEQNKACIM